jgi:nucleoid DNA-binding protein
MEIKNVTKADLIKSVRDLRGLTWSKSADCVDIILETIALGIIRGGYVKIQGFGRFYAKDVKERKHYLNNGAGDVVSARKRILFQASAALKRAANKKDKE